MLRFFQKCCPALCGDGKSAIDKAQIRKEQDAADLDALDKGLDAQKAERERQAAENFAQSKAQRLAAQAPQPPVDAPKGGVSSRRHR